MNPRPRASNTRVLVLVWVALLALLALSCTLAYVPMGRGNLVAGLAIAGVKATLVALFFMGLARSSSLLRVAAGAGLLWLAILFTLTFADVLTR